MVTAFEAALTQLMIHWVGNAANEERFVISEDPVLLDDEILRSVLSHYFLKPFQQVNEVYRFWHSSDELEMNELYQFANRIFRDEDSFAQNSAAIAKHLYEVSKHPKIKSGELYVVLFDQLQIEGEQHQALGIFKSENKETYLKVLNNTSGLNLEYEQQAVNINKLDKGCLIFDTEAEEGFKICIIDNTNKSAEALYWTDEFLKVKVRNDQYQHTSNYLSMCKDFVTGQLDQEFEMNKADKIDLLNRSMNYFKEKEAFNEDEFTEVVLGNDQAITSFKNYKQQFEEKFDVQLADNFDISTQAVKKQSRIFKSVLKLDKNFHIYIHGNKELIEKGFDDEKGMNFYKVYYKEEN